MAKRKPAKRKKRNKPYPPLSLIDKTIYAVLGVVFAVTAYSAIWSFPVLLKLFAFRNSAELAVDYTFPFLGFPLVALLGVSLAVSGGVICTCKRPIVGNKRLITTTHQNTGVLSHFTDTKEVSRRKTADLTERSSQSWVRCFFCPGFCLRSLFSAAGS